MSASTEFRKFYSVKQLEQVVDLHIKSNSALGIDKMTYKHFIENQKEVTSLINKKVLNGTYKFTPYKEKLILKSRHSIPRLISIPTLRDKLVLKSLHLVLTNTFSEIKQPLPQQCIQELKTNINDYSNFIKLDISNFYGAIKHGILFEKLKKKIKKAEILSLINRAITTQTVSNGESSTNKEIITQGVPQGLSISNILANIYLHDLDLKFSNRNDFKYIRYVDDIVILCTDDNLETVYNEVKYELEGIYSLPLNVDKEKKGVINRDGFDFLGYAFKGSSKGVTKLSVKEANKKRFENSIVKIFAKYKHSDNMSKEQFIFTVNNKVTGSISSKINGDENREFKYGWLFYFSQLEDTGFLYHLDWFVGELLRKFHLGHIDETKIKSFVKAFYEIKYNVKESDYLHRPDILTVEERRDLLNNTFNVPIYHLQTTNSVEKLYRKLVYKPIIEYEKDIHSIIS
ncbi:reverse transcriptase domain-containing protein [Bacillus marinisedimentorum]|uniref:reverse transcriptase domain-containing protein n=1 Tax=Bacillus marinisedimentorum TaxID=1821260 RepID=UPI0007E1190D|nr:reverse transcriptase domain-containing protein [Bacillus marinisedimentorum]